MDEYSRSFFNNYLIKKIKKGVKENIEEFKYILDQASRHSLVCLTYHHISDTAPPEASTPIQGFHEQMRYLKEAGFTVVLLPDLFRQ